MNLATIYIIRGAGFGRDFTPKLLIAFITIGMVLWDWRRQRRLDYLWVFVCGSLLWAAAEALLTLQGIRHMPVRSLFGQPLSLTLSWVIQGMSEGAFVAVVGLFVGDRILNRSTRISGLIAGVVVLGTIALATFRSRRFLLALEPASRRNLLDSRALLALAVLSLLVIVFYVIRKRWRQRTLMMFGFMVCLATVWSSTQVAVGGRWVEIDSAGYGYERAGSLITFSALAFDVVVEIALVYVSFLAIPVLLGLLRQPLPLPVTPIEIAKSRLTQRFEDLN
jgi:hypothetical protein